MTQTSAEDRPGRTAWSWVRDTPLRAFIRTETGSAVLLLAVTVLALVWVAVSPGSYEGLWSTRFSLALGSADLGQDLRGWVNNGLLTFFFLVIGLEARRSIDIGDLRERSRVLLPVLAGLGGMVASIGIYLAVKAGDSSAHGWGIAMSTDTAFALGLLSLAKAKPLAPLRSLMLTVVVVDDVVALLVIAIVYSDRVETGPLLFAIAVFGLAMVAVRLGMGLLAYASPAGRDVLEEATDRFRLFREQPTSDMARAATPLAPWRGAAIKPVTDPTLMIDPPTP